jgi:hypothetical protein
MERLRLAPKAIDNVTMARTEVSRELVQRVALDENGKSPAPAWPESRRSFALQ